MSLITLPFASAFTPTTTPATALLLRLIFTLNGLGHFGCIRFHSGLFSHFLFDFSHQRRIDRNNRRRNLNLAGLGLEFLDREIRRHQMRVSLKPHSHAVARFDLSDMFALHVHQEVDDRHGRLHQHLA